MAASPPSRRLHNLRGGDGPAIPSGRPPEMWPEFSEIERYFETFGEFARSELIRPSVNYQLRSDGTWQFVAEERPKRESNRRRRLVYEPEEDAIRFTDPEVGGWVLDNAFGRE